MTALVKTVMDVLSWLKGNFKMVIWIIGIAVVFGAGFYTAKRWFAADVVTCRFEAEKSQLHNTIAEQALAIDLLNTQLGKERLLRNAERDARQARDKDLVELRNRHEAARTELKRLKEMKHVQDWSVVPVPDELNKRLRDRSETHF